MTANAANADRWIRRATLPEASTSPRPPSRRARTRSVRATRARAAPRAESLEGRTLLSGVYYINDPTVAESDPGYTTTLSFRVDWVGSFQSEPGAVIVTTSDGTASAAEGDYTHRTTALQFPAFGGEPRFRTFTVTVNGDSRDEANETVVATLSSPGPVAIADPIGIGTITEDDDHRPTAQFVPVSPNPRPSALASVSLTFSEDVSGIDIADFTLTRDGGANLLTAAQTLATSDNRNFVVGNLAGLTGAAGSTYELRLRDDPASTFIADFYNNDLLGGAVVNWATLPGDADPDDQISEAIPAANGPTEGALSRGDNVDMYAFAALAGDAGAFDVSSAAGKFEPVLYSNLRLFNAAGTELASGPTSVRYTFTADGTFYVGVSEGGNAYDPVNGVDPVSTRAGGKYLLTTAGLTRVIGPSGPEFRVNTYTPSFQAYPATAMDAAGNFVVVWQSNGQDQVTGTNEGVYGQRYSAAGAPLGPEFRVNTTVLGNQMRPRVAMDPIGNFVVVWESPDGSGPGIFAQRYNAAGVAQGGEFPVNTTTAQPQSFPAVAMGGDVGFVVTWVSSVQDSNLDGVYAQRFTRFGVPAGPEFRVNTETMSHQRYPTIAIDLSGAFVIAWSSDLQDPDNSTGIYAQRFDAAGARRGVEFRVNTFTTSDQFQPSAAMDADGDFAVTWHGYEQSGNYGVFARRFDSGGAARGNEFRVSNTIPGFQRNTAIAMDEDGDLVIAWQDEHSGPTPGFTSVMARRFTSGGAAVAGEFVVNTTDVGHHRYPAAAMDADGDFVIAWAGYGQDPGDTQNQSGIYARRYGGPAAPVAPVIAEVFVRGSAWEAPSATSVTFMEYLEAKGLGDDVMGYRLFGTGRTPPAGNPEDVIPWINADQIVIRYSAAPTGAGVPTPGALTVAGRTAGSYSVIAVTQVPGDATTFVLQLNKPLGGGNPVTGVAPTGAENGDQITLGVAGGAAAGGNFSLPMHVLQGDTDHLGETSDSHGVLARDFAEVKKKFFKDTASPVGGTDSDYSVFHDVDASGSILARDFAEVKKRFFQNLPPPPAAAAGDRFSATRVADELLA